MISDQDRQIAEDTFGLIERSNPEPAPMTTTPLMNTFEATEFRAAWNAEVKALGRKTMPTLRDLDAAELRKQGRTRLDLGGRMSRYELIADILELRGYTTARLNETTHVLYHTDGAINSACEHCADVSMALAEHAASAIDKILGA